MKKISRYNLLAALLILLMGSLNSCTDVIDINVPNAGARLVVDASIKWEKGTSGATQTIYLRESTAYFDKDPDSLWTRCALT